MKTGIGIDLAFYLYWSSILIHHAEIRIHRTREIAISRCVAMWMRGQHKPIFNRYIFVELFFVVFSNVFFFFRNFVQDKWCARAAMLAQWSKNQSRNETHKTKYEKKNSEPKITNESEIMIFIDGWRATNLSATVIQSEPYAITRKEYVNVLCVCVCICVCALYKYISLKR